MRCADFGPTPGRQRSASISAASDGGYASIQRSQNGSFMPGGSCMPPVTLCHLLLRGASTLLHGVVDGGGDQVFEHVLVVAEHARVDA